MSKVNTVAMTIISSVFCCDVVEWSPITKIRTIASELFRPKKLNMLCTMHLNVHYHSQPPSNLLKQIGMNMSKSHSLIAIPSPLDIESSGNEHAKRLYVLRCVLIWAADNNKNVRIPFVWQKKKVLRSTFAFNYCW